MKKFLVFLSTILIFSCQEQVIELDIPNHDPFLVVNGILNTDSIISPKNADKIIILEEGEIIQRGTHADLIAEEGYYQELYRKQLDEKEME